MVLYYNGNVEKRKNEKTRKMSRLSVVLPAYNEELMVGKTCRVLNEILTEAGISYELVVVDDGSNDKSWEEITKAGERDKNVLGVNSFQKLRKRSSSLCRPCPGHGRCGRGDGLRPAAPAGNTDPHVSPWEQGWEVIEGVKKTRGTESLLHKESAGFFYGIMSKATGVNMQNASDFKMMDRKAVNSILSMPERNMFFRATSSWVGFKTTHVEFEVHDREAGQSKWSTWSLVKYAFTNIVAFTTVPLQFVTIVGGACFGCSLILIIYSLVQFFAGKAVEGYTTTLIVLLLIGSAIMLSLGIIGYYIAKIYEEVKRRPRYIISQDGPRKKRRLSGGKA